MSAILLVMIRHYDPVVLVRGYVWGWCTYAAYTQPHCTIGGSYWQCPCTRPIYCITML